MGMTPALLISTSMPPSARARSRNARNDSRCRHGHPPLRDTNFLHQQPRSLNEIVVVQEWFAHTHENKIDAILGRRHLLILEHRTHLTHNLARAEIPLNTKQRRQTELAIHGASHLAGNADRRAAGILSLNVFPITVRVLREPFRQLSGFASVPRFPSVAFRHPHGLNALSVGEGNQISHRAVLRHEPLLDPRQSDRNAFLRQSRSKLLG